MSELKHILVVDDDANNVELIRAALAARNFPCETVVDVVKPVDFTKFAEAIMAIGAFWTVVNAPPPIFGERAAAPAEAAAA